jgi:hypothetical protein
MSRTLSIGTGRATPVPSPENLRKHKRYAPVENEAWLGWWEGPAYRKSAATLVDISNGGAKVIAEIPPPRRSTIWICLDGQRRTEWVETQVVEVRLLPDNTAQVRMAFRELCPYSFFEAAVFGRDESKVHTSARGVTAFAAQRAGW